MRLGGNYLNMNDQDKYTYFHLVISGQVQSGTFDGKDGLCCSYEIVAGQDWVKHSVSTKFIFSR